MSENLPAIFNNYAISEIEDIRSVITENLGGAGISVNDFEKLKVPAQGETSWTVADLDGEKKVKELKGIIVFTKAVRAYWPKKEDKKPSCVSDDCETGKGDPGGSCASCPFSEFGSDPKGGRGQACKTMQNVFLLTKDVFLPFVLRLPPTSLKPLKLYLVRLSSRNVPYFGVETSITLEKKVNDQNDAYAFAVFNVSKTLEPAERQKVAAYRDGLLPILEKHVIEEDERPF